MTIITHIQNTSHHITIQKVHTRNNIFGNDEPNKLAKKELCKWHDYNKCPVPPHPQRFPHWLACPPIHTQHDSSIHNIKCNIQKNIGATSYPMLTIHFSMPSNGYHIDIHVDLSTLSKTSRHTSNAQITQLHKFQYGQYMGNFSNEKV